MCFYRRPKKEINVKKLLPLIALTVAASAFAQQQQPQWTIQNVGQSQKPAPQVAACIAKSWADKSQQQVISQDVLANDMAMDVYVPGQQPPNGAAAMVRPARSAGAATWVGFRSVGDAANPAAADLSTCL
ncbi:hypothetical protein [Burkholderia plantarii]|uniref:Putative exported protein n=1 Tax=Burkholderia plantarii TaxID=41899 RepID=A0A0B6RVM6_BURPL|nr:hypothetical protein [Burkholderia plantarii]AJK49367.1 putative exported protein [Burkholderia plantarii]WLE62633.1 hypothetical protein GIY62_19725 [Burkholderia plantarii]